MGGGERAALRARADPDLGPARGPAGFFFSEGAVRRLGAHAQRSTRLT